MFASQVAEEQARYDLTVKVRSIRQDSMARTVALEREIDARVALNRQITIGLAVFACAALPLDKYRFLGAPLAVATFFLPTKYLLPVFPIMNHERFHTLYSDLIDHIMTLCSTRGTFAQLSEAAVLLNESKLGLDGTIPNIDMKIKDAALARLAEPNQQQDKIFADRQAAKSTKEARDKERFLAGIKSGDLDIMTFFKETIAGLEELEKLDAETNADDAKTPKPKPSA